MKMQVVLGKPQPWVLPVTFVCLALGALIAMMMKASFGMPGVDPNARPQELRAQVVKLSLQMNDLEKENKTLRSEKDKMIDSLAQGEQNIKLVSDELNSLRLRAGTTPVEGRGIVITIDDSKMARKELPMISDSAILTHDVDLLMLVNELRAAGAEAIAINDQRVVAGTAIRCVGPVINVNNHQVGAPFVIKAVGKPDNLAGAMNLPFGVLDQLKQLGIQASVVKREKIRLPAIGVLMPYEESKVAPEDTEKAATKP
jgi:uncharacterized protein YlxW (UPF0749 family)